MIWRQADCSVTELGKAIVKAIREEAQKLTDLLCLMDGKKIYQRTETVS